MKFNDYNVGELYHVGCTSTRDSAFRYMLRNFGSVRETCNFQRYVDIETLCRLLSSIAVQSAADERLEAVTQWIRYDPKRRTEFIPRLLHHLPGALVDEGKIKSLRHDTLFRNSDRAHRALKDLPDDGNLAYHTTDNCASFSLNSLRECGGEKLFRFTSAEDMAEFELFVTASACLQHLKFKLICNRVEVKSSRRLPEDVSADLKVRLYRSDHRGDMTPFDSACIWDDDVTLATDGRKIAFCSSLQYNGHEMNRIINCNRKISLSVKFKKLTVNGRTFDYSSSNDSNPYHHWCRQDNGCRCVHFEESNDEVSDDGSDSEEEEVEYTSHCYHTHHCHCHQGRHHHHGHCHYCNN